MAWILSDSPAPFPWMIEDTVRDSEVAMGPVNSGWTHDEEARIARLIAAAPVMHALLVECLANSPERRSDWRDRVEAVLTQVRGES